MSSFYSSNSNTQSRFAASSNSTTTANDSPQPGQLGPWSRLSSSKSFSASVSNLKPSSSSDTVSSNGEAPLLVNGGTSIHPLRSTWVFWFRQQRAPGNKLISYEEGIKRISSFSSVESFWNLWTHLSPPSTLQPTTDYLLFHSGVQRPVWEDPLNLSGGKWIIRLKKGVADRVWEDIVLAIIGDQFDACRSERTGAEKAQSPGEGSEGEGIDWPPINGCTISVRQSEDIISVWNRVDGDVKVREKIRDTIRRVLRISPLTTIEYKSNNDSMQDKSSFRNSAIDRSPVIP